MFSRGSLASVAAQAVLNLLVRSPYRRGRRFRTRLYRTCRRSFLRMTDPIVKYRIDGITLTLPLSHDLPLIRELYPHYMTNLSRLLSSLYEKYPDLSVVDIGANVGDTAVVIRRTAPVPLLCIEGDPYFFGLLITNTSTFTDVFCERAFISNKTGSISGSLLAHAGTAHFATDPGSSASPCISLAAQLNRHPRFLESRLIKIDTDGFDIAIIDGAIDFLGAHKPVVFFEYD